MRKQFLTISIILLAVLGYGQNYKDALRYSQYYYGGTARSISMGSAFGALGADFSSASINPAGMGLYRSGEFAISPTLQVNNAEAAYLGATMKDNRYNLNLNNISYVNTVKTNSDNGIVSITFGFGTNRLNTFNNNYLMGGDNAKSSQLDYFTDYANQGYMDPYNEELAWNANLLPFDTLSQQYWNDVAEANYGQSQRKSVSEKGKVTEYAFTLGANINHKVYIGATIGLHNVSYKQTSEYSEWDAKNNIDYFNSYSYNSSLSTSGSGFNVKLGAIFRPTKDLRLGVAIHTPTFYAMTDSYYSSISQTNDFNESVPTQYSPDGKYDYEIQTPLRAVLSAAYTFSSFGLISVDYERINYSSAKLRNGGDNYSFVDENNEIQKRFKSTGNLRIGGEIRATPNFSIRAGYEMYGNAFNNSFGGVDQPAKSNSYNTYSAGFGYRQKDFFFDMAYRMSASKEKYWVHGVHPESPNINIPVADISGTKNQITMTLGFKF